MDGQFRELVLRDRTDQRQYQSSCERRNQVPAGLFFVACEFMIMNTNSFF